MIMQIIFKKLGLWENKALMALAYGGIYSLLFFVLMSISTIYLKKQDILRTALMSLFIWIMMFIVYFIKAEMMKMRKP